MRITRLLTLLFLTTLLISCNNGNIISDKKIKEELSTDFNNRMQKYPTIGKELKSYFENDISQNEKEALKYLYTYMSANDIADYPIDFFLKNIRYSFKAKEEMNWGKKVPNDLFRHFVLPLRVNNEDLDSSRIVFFNELKERLKGMSMQEAALEVNHWCHEKVTYRPADRRTSSPLASIKTGYGRCGEESTFTVTALRAVGIPARQCYTPRWAHTDDNHAWVEVWADGKWYFLGACEPEPKLNMAWFTFPVKRAMMVHTNVFGKYYGKESKTDFPLFTKINVLENYTQTKKLTVKVVDENETPIADANVKYLLYNYADFYPIYEKNTNKDGFSHVISGEGDIVVWASKNDKYSYQQVSLTDTENLTIQLTRTKGQDYEEELDLIPPKNQAVFVNDNSDERKLNNKKLLYEDSIRNSYLATFINKEEALKIAKDLKLDEDKTTDFILKSEGSHEEIIKYLKTNAQNPYALSLLSTLSNKDLRDTRAKILENHLHNAINEKEYPKEVFVKGILSPRIDDELIRDWRDFLQKEFASIFSKKKVTGEDILEWTQKNITLIEDNENYSNCLISPKGVLKIRKADKQSLKLFYTALCKSLGIPTYIDNATKEIMQYNNGWNVILLEKKSEEFDHGKLTLKHQNKSNITPEYDVYYTISKFENGTFKVLDYYGDSRVAKFPFTLKLEAGYYRLTSGNRYASGKILAKNKYFNLQKGETKTIDLEIRELQPEKKSYGKIDQDSLLSPMYNQKGMVILFLEPDREPTKHLLNELPYRKSEFDKWQGNFVFVIPEDKLSDTSMKLSNKLQNLPQNSTFITKNGTEIMNKMLFFANQSFRENYPLVYVVNKNGEIIFHSEGYRIGVGNLINNTIQQSINE